MSNTSFSKLKLPTAQLENLQSLGYLEMTAIQEKALPLALSGNDILAQAKTGSGKTAAFALAIIDQLNPRDFGTQALVLCPTRELATQVAKEIRRLARYRQNIKVVSLCGGQSIGPQIGSLEHGAHIVVGTPGRIKDHLRKKTLSIARIKTLVLDEADRMLAMGFIDDMETIIQQSPQDRQTMLFSATYPEDIQTLSRRFQKSPHEVTVESLHDDNKIAQFFYLSPKGTKLEAILTLLDHYVPNSMVIFCNTKQETRNVEQYLLDNNVATLALHGDLEQRDRDQILVQFKQLSCRILVATDVAARGLDIDELSCVLNFDLPRDPEIYIHRIGRTGRAGKEGIALSLLHDSERYKMALIETYQKRDFSPEPIESLAGAGNNGRGVRPPAFRTLKIAAGRKEKIRPGDILGALTGNTDIDGSAVGNIEIMDYTSYVAIERDQAKRALRYLSDGKIKGRNFRVRML